MDVSKKEEITYDDDIDEDIEYDEIMQKIAETKINFEQSEKNKIKVNYDSIVSFGKKDDNNPIYVIKIK